MKALLNIDHQLTDKIRTWGQSSYRFWNFMASQSIAVYVLLAIMFAYFDGLNFWHFLAIFALSYVIAVTFQHFIKRHRPDFKRNTGYKMWIETYSFPSAHATMSAAAATAIAMLTVFPSSIVGIITMAGCVIFALLIGISRLVVGVHYLADVTVGWLLGIVVASGYIVLLSVII